MTSANTRIEIAMTSIDLFASLLLDPFEEVEYAPRD